MGPRAPRHGPHIADHIEGDDIPAYSDWSAKGKHALVDDVANAVVERILDADMNAHEKGDKGFHGCRPRTTIKAYRPQGRRCLTGIVDATVMTRANYLELACPWPGRCASSVAAADAASTLAGQHS